MRIKIIKIIFYKLGFYGKIKKKTFTDNQVILLNIHK